MKQNTKVSIERKAALLGITYQELVKRRVWASLEKKAAKLGITAKELQLQRVKASQHKYELDNLWFEALKHREQNEQSNPTSAENE
jgi:hypothetical protein